MQILSQRVGPWANDHIGASSVTCAQDGCAFMSLINGCRAMGLIPLSFDPRPLLHDASNFDAKGDILWDVICPKISPKLVHEGNEYNEDDTKIFATLKDPDRFVILNVDFGRHFVLGWHKPFFGKDIIAADSWYGQLKPVKATWHNIVGERYFRVKR